MKITICLLNTRSLYNQLILISVRSSILTLIELRGWQWTWGNFLVCSYSQTQSHAIPRGGWGYIYTRGCRAAKLDAKDTSPRCYLLVLTAVLDAVLDANWKVVKMLSLLSSRGSKAQRAATRASPLVQPHKDQVHRLIHQTTSIRLTLRERNGGEFCKGQYMTSFKPTSTMIIWMTTVSFGLCLL